MDRRSAAGERKGRVTCGAEEAGDLAEPVGAGDEPACRGVGLEEGSLLG